MTIESILIKDDNANSSSDLISKTQEDLNAARKKQETIDFKMVTFSLSGKDYAIDIMYVKEIAKAGQFTFVPNTLPFVIGVYNLRGDIIPILDMRIFFHAPVPEQKEGALRNLLILTVGEQTFGIVVDKIDKVVGIQKNTIQPPHPMFSDINVKYISGVVEANKRLYILLDIERIFFKTKDEAVEEEKNTTKMIAQDSMNIPQQKAVPAFNSTKSEGGVGSAVKKEAAPVVSQDYQFVVEELKTFGKFNVSSVNENWVKSRFESWSKERGAGNAQLQNEGDASAFLKPFWSSFDGGWWSKEYADAVAKVLPDNSAKQIMVWNPGCGKGSETFCLACVLAKRYPESKIRVYAQDVDLLMVANAPMLTVPESEAGGWLRPFISKTASGANTFNQQIKDSIMFEYHDCGHTNALPMLDIVFARDLLSVVNEEALNSVKRDFEDKLKGNGVLIIGENEQLEGDSVFVEKSVGSVTAYNKQ